MDGLKIDESLVPKIIGIVVAVIVVSVVLIPITEEVTDTHDSINNIGNYYVLKNPEEATIIYADSVLTINDEVIPVPTVGNGYGVSVLSLGNGVLRYTPNGQLIKWGSITPYNSVPITTANITVSNGALTGTVVYSGSETDVSISATIDGDYYVLQKTKNDEIMTLSTSKTYVLKDTIVESNGVTNIDSNAVYGTCVFDVIGSIDGGFTVKAYNRNAGTDITENLGIDNVTAHYTKIDGYKDLYLLDKVTFTTTTDADTPVTANLSYDYFAAPTVINAEKSIHADDMTNTIISLIPIFVVLAILMGIVGLMYFNRNGQ